VILDAIIGLFVSLFSLVAQTTAIVFVPLINLIAAAIEALIGLFVSGFSLGRIERKKNAAKSPASVIGSLLPFLILAGVIGWFIILPKFANKEVTLIADDGHNLPFAALIIHTNNGDDHQRTDNAGKVVISKSRTTAITVKDPRYVEETWQKAEIESALIVKRTVLGSSLDSLADKLLKPVTE